MRRLKAKTAGWFLQSKAVCGHVLRIWWWVSLHKHHQLDFLLWFLDIYKGSRSLNPVRNICCSWAFCLFTWGLEFSQWFSSHKPKVVWVFHVDVQSLDRLCCRSFCIWAYRPAALQKLFVCKPAQCNLMNLCLTVTLFRIIVTLIW